MAVGSKVRLFFFCPNFELVGKFVVEVITDFMTSEREAVLETESDTLMARDFCSV